MTAEQTRYESGHEYRCEGCSRIVNPDREPSPGEPVTCAECTPVESDADLLRRAARVMRERAMHSCLDGAWYDQHDLHQALSPVADSVDDPEADAEHIASWHPTVALAVADWLDGEANKQTPTTHLAITFDGSPMFPVDERALTVARTYLGEQP